MAICHIQIQIPKYFQSNAVCMAGTHTVRVLTNTPASADDSDSAWAGPHLDQILQFGDSFVIVGALSVFQDDAWRCVARRDPHPPMRRLRAGLGLHPWLDFAPVSVFLEAWWGRRIPCSDSERRVRASAHHDQPGSILL